MTIKTATDIASDMKDRGVTTTPNVEAIRMMGVRIVSGIIPASVRKELREAVKDGRLGHLKKDGLMPEAFFHPNSRFRAIGERNAIARESIEALRKVCAPARVEDWE